MASKPRDPVVPFKRPRRQPVNQRPAPTLDGKPRRRPGELPAKDEDVPEVEPGRDIAQGPTDALFERLLHALGTMTEGSGHNLVEALGVEHTVHLEWCRRGFAEIDRVAVAPARRTIRASERPYVRWARMTSQLPTAATPLVTMTPEGKGVIKGPTMLTPAVADAFLAALADGVSDKGACGIAGISTRTVDRWIARGNAELERLEAGEELSEADMVYAVFVLRHSRVRGDVERELAKLWRLGAEGLKRDDGTWMVDDNGKLMLPPDWKAAMALLQHRYGREWRIMDAKADDDSASVVAARAGRPVQIVVHHSPDVLSDAPIEVAGHVIDADSSPATPQRVLPPGVSEPDVLEEREAGDARTLPPGVDIEELGGDG